LPSLDGQITSALSGVATLSSPKIRRRAKSNFAKPLNTFGGFKWSREK
jgi:hypothetical protein